MSANVPAIRFSGFADPWEQRKLGEVCSIERGERFTAADYVESGGIPCIHYGEVYTDYGPVATEAISQVCPGLEGRLRYANPGDIILTSTSENVEDVCKAVAWMGKTQVSYHDDSFALSHSEDSLFLTSYFQTGGFSEQKAAMAHGVKVMRVGQEDLANISIPLPRLPEQRAVGALFSRLDSLIALHQRKHNQLSILKSSLLERMFPKPGSDVPELRFSGFADPWEQRKLGELGVTYGGLNGKSKEDFGHGDARFVPYTNVFDNPIADSTRLGEVEIDVSQNRVLHGDTLFTVSSETPNEVGMSSVWLSDLDNLYLNSFCFGYRQDGSFDPYYLAYMLRSQSVRENIELLAQGISRFNISKGKVMEVEVPVPMMAEQRAVGALFSRLDSLIALHQRKLEKLRALKQSLLQKMFV